MVITKTICRKPGQNGLDLAGGHPTDAINVTVTTNSTNTIESTINGSNERSVVTQSETSNNNAGKTDHWGFFRRRRRYWRRRWY